MSTTQSARGADRLRADPSVLANARRRVATWCETGAVHPRYAEAWKALLDRPIETIVAALVDESEQMTALRQTSPFAGVLDPRTRWQLWRSVG